MLIFDPFYFSHLRVNSSEIPSRMGIDIALRVIYADRLVQRPFSKFSIAAVLRIAFISRVFPPRAQLGQLTNSQLRACRSRDRPYLRPQRFWAISARRCFVERIKQIAGVPALYSFVDESVLTI